MKKLQSKILASAEWPRIKEVIDAHLGKKSRSYIYKIVIGIDKNIGSYDNFNKFLKNWTAELTKRQEIMIVDAEKNRGDLLQDITDEAISNVDLLENSVNKALQLGDIVIAKTLEEVKKKVEKGRKIDLKEKALIMKWFGEAGRIVYEGETLKLKRMAGARDTVALGLLCRSARSGNLPDTDLPPIEGENITNQINEPSTNREAQQSAI